MVAGAERTVIQLANSFAEQGLQIDLAVCNLSGEKEKLLPEVNSKIQLINFNCGRVANAFPLKKRLQEQQYDCVVAANPQQYLCFCQKNGGVNTRLIFREVSTPSKNMKLSGFKKFILTSLINWTYNTADQVVCVEWWLGRFS